MRPPADRPTTCVAPGCGASLPEPARLGRPRLYCSPSCRARQPPRSVALTVEVDHQVEGDGGRPTGRIWIVRLRRGQRHVVVATELGRPSADHLASQIAELITPRQRANRGAME